MSEKPKRRSVKAAAGTVMTPVLFFADMPVAIQSTEPFLLTAKAARMTVLAVTLVIVCVSVLTVAEYVSRIRFPEEIARVYALVVTDVA